MLPSRHSTKQPMRSPSPDRPIAHSAQKRPARAPCCENLYFKVITPFITDEIYVFLAIFTPRSLVRSLVRIYNRLGLTDTPQNRTGHRSCARSEILGFRWFCVSCFIGVSDHHKPSECLYEIRKPIIKYGILGLFVGWPTIPKTALERVGWRMMMTTMMMIGDGRKETTGWQATSPIPHASTYYMHLPTVEYWKSPTVSNSHKSDADLTILREYFVDSCFFFVFDVSRNDSIVTHLHFFWLLLL